MSEENWIDGIEHDGEAIRRAILDTAKNDRLTRAVYSPRVRRNPPLIFGIDEIIDKERARE